MLITCEECGAIYCIAEKIIGSMGRKVKCTRCQHVWMIESKQAPSQALDPCLNLPILYKPALPKALRLIPIFLIFAIILINFIFFPELFTRVSLFRDLYQKCGFYSSDGLFLDNFIFELNKDEVLINGFIQNNSNENKMTPDVRYILLDKDKNEIFKYTQKSSYKLLKPGESFSINTKVIHLKEDANMLQIDIGNKLELLLK